MKRLMLPMIALAASLASASYAGEAAPKTAIGSTALVLASLVSEQSPVLSLDEKSILGQMLRPNPNFSYLAERKISVTADTIICRQSNVDIAARSCELTFGEKKVIVKGRKAHEMFATIAEVGVPPDGAAGTIYESLSHLACAIDSGEVKQKTGGGAECKFEPGSK